MHHDRKGAVGIRQRRAPDLAGMRHAHDDGVDALQMGGIARERDRDLAMARHDRAPASEVVDQVAVPFGLAGMRIEVIQHVRRRHSQDVDQHVDSPAMWHSEEDLLDSLGRRPPHQGVQKRQQGLAPFEREALAVGEALTDVMLPGLGLDQPVQQPAPAEWGGRGLGFHARMQPCPAHLVPHGAAVQGKRPAVDGLESLVQFANLQGPQQGRPIGRETVSRVQPESRGQEVWRPHRVRRSPGVECRAAVAPLPMRIDEALDIGPGACCGKRGRCDHFRVRIEVIPKRLRA